ncbi:MAG TPA: hypothetical protein VMH86_05685 [Rhizomicrobium sp.]|nr:hypothetical protein [Rhizomicrobium sp.]
MTATASATSLNREIVDDRDGRLSIHTQEIRLTQAQLPYQPVKGKRLASTKHFAVYADRIVLGGVLQNPGRDIELNAREIVVEKPVTLDVAGAYADKDFPPGDLPTQKDAKPGAAGTDGADATRGGDAGNILINARVVSSRIPGAHPLSVTELASIGQRIFSEHPPRIDNAAKLARFVLGSTRMFGNEMTIHLDDGRVEGFARLSLDSASFDGTANRMGMRLNLPALTVNGLTQMSGLQRLSSQAFACRIEAAAAMDAAGKAGAIETALSLVSGKPIKVPAPYIDGILPAAALDILRKQIAAHMQGAIQALFEAFAGQLRKAPLILLAGGGRGGRGQDGHPGMQGEKGEDGAKTSQHGVDTGRGYGFPDEANGKNGKKGGQAGSPGASANGGNGGRIALNVVDPVTLDILCDAGGGEGGVEASPGARGPGGPGGRGAVCKMFNQATGRPVEDQKAPDGQSGPDGPAAQRGGKKGEPGSAGAKLQFNGKPFAGGQAAPLSLAALAQSLSLSQLLIAQNTADMDFLNAKTEADLAAVAAAYSWLVDINGPFTGAAAGIDPGRVPPLEQKVRAGIHNGAIVSLMRLQQGLDFYGHSYNWTPVLSLAYLAGRTAEMIAIGEVVQTQYEKYLKKGATDEKRMAAFRTARQKIDTKLKDFGEEIGKINDQIDGFRTEIEDFSEDIRKQRTLLLEGQLAFKDQLIKHLREESELGLTDFLDMLGTVVGCVGGVVGGVGGVKSAIDAVKKAEEFSKQVKGVVEVFKKAKATIDSIKKAYSAIKDLIDVEGPNAAKIMVDGSELDDLLKKYLGKFDAAGELRKALDYYLKLCQARNMAAYNYTTQVAQLLTAQAQRDQLYSGIQHINAEMAAHQDNVLPVYTAYLRDAYEDVLRDLMRNIYLENRAYQYWSLQERQLETENLNVATLGDTHRRLMKAIDAFRESKSPFASFRQKVTISAGHYPDEFAAMARTGSLVFTLDIRKETGFRSMSYIAARAFKLEFPDIQDKANVLTVNLIHSGQAVLNSDVDRNKPGALHFYSHQPRVLFYQIDYAVRENIAGGDIGDDAEGYIGLSPFTLWRIDFGTTKGFGREELDGDTQISGNEWLDLKSIRTIELTFEGRMLGAGRKVNVTPP